MKKLVALTTLVKRINRKLATTHHRVRTLRGDAWLDRLGRHYVVDVGRNALVEADVSLEVMARELGVLAPSERCET
jgi:hypothetical protein